MLALAAAVSLCAGLLVASSPTSVAGSAAAAALGVPLKRGWNLGNTLEGCAPSENPNGDWVFKSVAAAGFDWTRIPAQWGCHALEVEPYTVDPAFLATVNETVGWA